MHNIMPSWNKIRLKKLQRHWVRCGPICRGLILMSRQVAKEFLTENENRDSPRFSLKSIPICDHTAMWDMLKISHSNFDYNGSIAASFFIPSNKNPKILNCPLDMLSVPEIQRISKEKQPALLIISKGPMIDPLIMIDKGYSSSSKLVMTLINQPISIRKRTHFDKSCPNRAALNHIQGETILTLYQIT
jgi:hypothetical protein